LPQPSARFFEGLHLGTETETIASKCEIEVAIEQKTRGYMAAMSEANQALGWIQARNCYIPYQLTQCHLSSVPP